MQVTVNIYTVHIYTVHIRYYIQYMHDVGVRIICLNPTSPSPRGSYGEVRHIAIVCYIRGSCPSELARDLDVAGERGCCDEVAAILASDVGDHR